MEYNSARKNLALPEYGRSIHEMVEHIKELDDKEKRNKAARSLIEIMGDRNPHLRDFDDFTHKLWDHLFIMADYELDVHSPYPIPEKKDHIKPERLKYAEEQPIRYKYYGRTVKNFIKKATDMEEGKEKEALIEVIANLMKKFYLTYNKESVDDEVINNHLKELSDGSLKIKDEYNIDSTNEILSHKNKKRKRGNKSNHRRRKNYKK